MFSSSQQQQAGVALALTRASVKNNDNREVITIASLFSIFLDESVSNAHH
jgi:hypothetical protein